MAKMVNGEMMNATQQRRYEEMYRIHLELREEDYDAAFVFLHAFWNVWVIHYPDLTPDECASAILSMSPFVLKIVEP